MIELVEVDYAYVARYKRSAEREGVCLSPTKNTIWLRTKGHEGFAGLIFLPKDRCRLKAAWVSPEWRGAGFGTALTEGRIKIARERGVRRIEVISLHPHHFDRLGFTRKREVRPGSWEMYLDV